MSLRGALYERDIHRCRHVVETHVYPQREESVQNAQRGESEAGVVIEGDVEVRKVVEDAALKARNTSRETCIFLFLF